MLVWYQLDFSAIPGSIIAVSRKTNLAKCKQYVKIAFVWGEVSNSWILNDIGRNFLLGSRKKIRMFNEDFYLPLYNVPSSMFPMLGTGNAACSRSVSNGRWEG
jgi:hypothetical protein